MQVKILNVIEDRKLDLFNFQSVEIDVVSVIWKTLGVTHFKTNTLSKRICAHFSYIWRMKQFKWFNIHKYLDFNNAFG